MSTAHVILKIALAAAERGDAVGAAEALRAVLALGETPPAPVPTVPTSSAVTRTAFAEMMGATPEHVGHLIARGEIPAEAIIGRGRGLRIRVDVALAALRPKPSPSRITTDGEPTDAIEAEGASYVRRRGRLRVVGGQR